MTTSINGTTPASADQFTQEFAIKTISRADLCALDLDSPLTKTQAMQLMDADMQALVEKMRDIYMDTGLCRSSLNAWIQDIFAGRQALQQDGQANT